MVYVTTEWDYSLKTEVFVVQGDKGYAHTTDTILKEVGTHDTSVIDYFTASFNVDVLRDIQDSKVVIYDNGEPISLHLDGNQVEMIDWQQGGQSTTFSLRLGYGVEHNIYAKYLGNKKGLPSKSQTLTISEPMPELYGTLIERTTTKSHWDRGEAISIPIEFTTNETFESAEVKLVDLYVDGELETDADVTIPSSQTSGTGTFVVGTLPDGNHDMEIRFDGDEHNEAFYLQFQISVGYKIVITEHSAKMVRMQTPIPNYNFVRCKVTDYLDNPIANARIELQDADSWGTGQIVAFDSITTDSDGIGNFNLFGNASTNLGISYTKNFISYKSEAFDVPVIQISDVHLGVEKIIADGYTTNALVSLREYSGLPSGETLEMIPVRFHNGSDVDGLYYTNLDGVATIPYTGSNRGNVTLTAIAGDATYTNTVEDITQFWSAERNLNKDYRVLAPNFYELNTGFRFEVRASNSMTLIGFEDGEQYTGSWAVSFEVVTASKNIKLVAGSWYDVGESEVWENILQSAQVSLKNGQKVNISYTVTDPYLLNGTLKIELPGNVVSSSQCQGHGSPLLGITSATANAQLTIDNVKFRRFD